MAAFDYSLLRDVPDPTPTEDTLPFWEAARSGRLIVQACTACGRGAFPPRPALCPHCHGETEWISPAAEATVYSWAGIDRVIHEWLRAVPPFTVVIAALAALPDVRIPCFFPEDRSRLAVDGAGRILFHDVGRRYPVIGFSPS